MREHNSFENNWFQNKPRLFFDCVSTVSFLSPLFSPFFTTRQRPSYSCDTLYWFCYPLMWAHIAAESWVVFFFTKCVSRVLSARVSLSPRNIHVFRALVYSLPIFIPVSFLFANIRKYTRCGELFFWFDILIFMPFAFFHFACRLTTFRISMIIHLEFI